MFNELLSSPNEVKKLFESLHPTNDSDLNNISKHYLHFYVSIAINNGLIEHDIAERYNFKPIYAASTLI